MIAFPTFGVAVTMPPPAPPSCWKTDPVNTYLSVKIWEHYAIAAERHGPIGIIDLSNPRAPVRVGEIPETHFCACSWSGFIGVPVCDLGALPEVHRIFIDEDGYLYVAGIQCGEGSYVYDLSVPAIPQWVCHEHTRPPGSTSFYDHDVFAADGILYFSRSRGLRWEIHERDGACSPSDCGAGGGLLTWFPQDSSLAVNNHAHVSQEGAGHQAGHPYRIGFYEHPTRWRRDEGLCCDPTRPAEDGGSNCHGVPFLDFLDDGRFVASELNGGLLVGQFLLSPSSVDDGFASPAGKPASSTLQVLGRPGSAEMRIVWMRPGWQTGDERPGRRDAVELEIFSAGGALVARLAPEEERPDRVEFRWDGRNDRRRRLPGGVYLARAQVSGSGRPGVRATDGSAASTSLILLH